jgi:hypothetical protein
MGLVALQTKGGRLGGAEGGGADGLKLTEFVDTEISIEM